MKNIDQIINMLDNTKIEISDYFYKKIHDGLRPIREKRKKKVIKLNIYKLFIRYALVCMILFILGISYFHSSHIPISIIEKRGFLSVASVEGKWRKLDQGEKIKQGWILQSGCDSNILIQFGKYLTIKLNGNSQIEIRKSKRFLKHEMYEFYVSKGNYAYSIIDKNLGLLVLTDELELRHIGTKFNIIADKSGTCIKVLKGKVRIKRSIKGSEKFEIFEYEKNIYKKKLRSIINRENVISNGESIFVNKQGDKKIKGIINQVAKEGKVVNKKIISKIQKNMAVEYQMASSIINWKYNAKSPVWATPVLYKGNLYFGTENGNILSISEKGKLNWRKKVGSSFLNKGTVYKDKYYIVDSKGVLYRVDMINPAIIKKKQVGEMMYSVPVIKNNKLFLATTLGKIMMLDPDNKEKTIWQKKIWSGIYCKPAIKGEKIYFGSENGTIYCINWLNSDIEWEIDTKSRMVISSPLIYKDMLYIGNNKGIFYAIEINKGEIKWKRKLRGRILSKPVVKERDFFISTSEGMIYSMNLKGEINWELDLQEKIEAPFEIAGEIIVVPTKQGNVYVIDKKNGIINRKIKLQDKIVSAPIIKNNLIYITTMKGRIYKLAINDLTALKPL